MKFLAAIPKWILRVILSAIETILQTLLGNSDKKANK